jgi:hypothetical protein
MRGNGRRNRRSRICGHLTAATNAGCSVEATKRSEHAMTDEDFFFALKQRVFNIITQQADNKEAAFKGFVDPR